MTSLDDTWKFWARFVFEDCKPYIALFIAIRSENWHLRMAALKMMAANFTAFNHPNYQKLITWMCYTCLLNCWNVFRMEALQSAFLDVHFTL